MQCSEAMLIMSQCYLFKDCQYMSIKYDLHETCVCFRYIDNECNIKRDLFITVSMSCAAFLPVVFLTKVPAEHASFEGLSEPEFDKTMEVKTSINVLNTLEDIFINDIDNTVEPEEESTMSKMFEDLGSGSGSEEETEDNMTKNNGDEMMTGIDPGLLETSVTAENDVEIFR